MMRVQPRVGEGGEFLGCQASVAYRDTVVEACMVEPVKVEGDMAQAVGATLLQAQSWCQFTAMVLAMSILAPAGDSDYGALSAWIAAVRRDDLPAQVGDVLDKAVQRTAAEAGLNTEQPAE